jgi:hypothetical protein
MIVEPRGLCEEDADTREGTGKGKVRLQAQG